MDSAEEIMQVCRLCLVKEAVNIPIFDEEGDDGRIFLKISTCLPVKVSKEDNLPKNICDGCSSKLEELYEFWNKSASSEKKLVKWLCQLELDKSDKMQHSMNTSDPVILKQEVVDVAEGDSTGDDLIPEDLNVSNDAPDYMLQQQLPYQPVEIQFQQDGFETTSENSLAEEKETKSKLCKRRAAAMKALASFQSEDEDDADLVNPKIAKTEDPSDESGEEPEPTAFVSLPSGDNEQPGPSGVGKSSNDAPYLVKIKMETLEEDYSLAEDLKKRRRKRQWNCTKCCESFDTSRKLRTHRKMHRKKADDVQYNYRHDNAKNIFICYTCDFECVLKEDMEKHVLDHEDKFSCKVCDETFVKPYEYSCHLYNHDQTKGFSCPFCKYTTHRRTAIMIHINTYHLRKFIYTCHLCGKGFNDCVLFKEHNNVHEGKRPFRCVVCDKDFVFSSYLTSHQIRYHRVTIDGVLGSNQCCVCFKSFIRKTTLEKHMKTHNGDQKKVHEKRHLCDICGKGFAQTEKLRIHYRVHTGIKPYTCSYCAKGFIKRDYLIMHERVHSGEKPYSCEYCGKCFNQSAPLRLHVRNHTGERPYLCHLCNTGYISRSVLNLHLKNCPGGLE